MTVAPEEVSVRSSRDFLIMVDMYIEAKITRVQRDASNFTSQDELSLSIQNMYKVYMIPCLFAVKRMIQMVPEALSGEDLKHTIDDARYACILLISYIEQKKKDLEDIKQQSVNPAQIEGINLIQGVYTDIVDEIRYIPFKTK